VTGTRDLGIERLNPASAPRGGEKERGEWKRCIWEYHAKKATGEGKTFPQGGKFLGGGTAKQRAKGEKGL